MVKGKRVGIRFNVDFMHCIILAGGFATRLWPLSENKAKPLLHLKDRPIISHIVEKLPAGLDLIVSTNAAFAQDFKMWSRNYPQRKIRIFVEDSKANESKKGAIGALALAIQEEKIDDDLLLIAGDNYCGFSLADFLKAFRNRPLLAAYDIQDKKAARKFGVVVAENGVVKEFQEKPQEPKSTLVSTGCYVFPRRILPDILEYAKGHKDNLGGIFEYLLQKHETIDVFTFHEPWYDIGSFEGYLRANRELLGGQVIGENTAPRGRNRFLGGVYLGDKARVEDSQIEHSVILKNCVIKNCVIRNCVIDENSNLEGIDLNRQMIRAGSVIKKT